MTLLSSMNEQALKVLERGSQYRSLELQGRDAYGVEYVFTSLVGAVIALLFSRNLEWL